MIKLQDNEFKVGDLLVIEYGEYSDKGWNNPVRVVKQFTQSEVARLFEATPPTDEWHDKPQPDDFLPWLTKSGYVEDVPNVYAWHVGSYGDFEPGV